MKALDLARRLAATLATVGTLTGAAAADQSAPAAGSDADTTSKARAQRLPPMTETQALHVLQVDLSRNVGKEIKEADYPEDARRWNWSGTTLVRVLMGVDGSMKEVSVSRTSGFRTLDDQAVRIVRRTAVPPMPLPLRGREVAVTVPIGFYVGAQ